MRSVSEIGGVTFLRPLLSMTRGEIELFLRSCGVEEWASDSSNASTVYLRNYLRNILLPGLEEHFPGSLKGMDRSLHALEEDADFISSYVEAIPSGSRKSISFWRSQHNAVRIRLLRELTGTLPTRDLLARINRELENDSSELRRIPVPGGGEIFLRGDTIEKGSPTVPAPDTLLWEWRKEPAVLFGKWRFSAVFAENTEKCSTDCAFFDAELLPDVLEISLPRPGERMIPFGAKSEQKIKKLRTDRHLHSGIPLPVVRADGKICWAVLVRHSASAPVTSETKKIVKFTCQEF